MSKYFVIIGLTAFLLCALFLLVSYVSPFKSRVLTSRQDNSNLASLYFNPATIESSCINSIYTIPIYLSTNTPVNSVQIEISFNPDVIFNLSLAPSENNFFGSNKNYRINLQEVREQFGRASLALSLNSDQKEVRGNTQVAVLSFTINSLLPNITSQISFLNKSTVGSFETQSSLLQKTVPLSIYCSPVLRNTSTPSSQLSPSQ